MKRRSQREREKGDNRPKPMPNTQKRIEKPFPSDVQRIKFSEIQFLLFDFSGPSDVTVLRTHTGRMQDTHGRRVGPFECCKRHTLWTMVSPFGLLVEFTVTLFSFDSLKFQHSFRQPQFDPFVSARKRSGWTETEQIDSSWHNLLTF